MVWIHGGSFQFGSGDCALYSPEHLVKNGVVVVTLNYRLGALGFLCNPELGIYGNMGLKDQLLALKWVHENISAFGGDPRDVTLFGESVGGVSAHFHLLNAVSKQYFHKAISQSGSCLMGWVYQVDPIEKSWMLGGLLGAKSPGQTLDVLMHADAKEMTKVMLKTLSDLEQREGMAVPFRFVIEVPNKTAFLTESPVELLKQKDIFGGIPLLSGINDMEGIYMTRAKRRSYKRYQQNMCRFVPEHINLTFGSAACQKVAQQIHDFYFKDARNEADTLVQMAKYQTDRYFHMGHYASGQAIAKYQPGTKHFMYRFCFDGELNYFKQIYNKEIPGACHADDCFYLFG